MRTPTPLLAAGAFLSLVPCPAQGAPAKRAPLVIAPGSVDVRAVIRQVGKALGHEYRIEEWKAMPAATAGRLTLRLQNPLSLDPGTAEAVLSEIAAARGLMLVLDGTTRRWLFAGGPEAREVTGEPRQVTLAELFDPALPRVRVRTGIDVEKEPMRVAQLLRPYFMTRTATLRIHTVGEKTVELTGLRHEVALAARAVRTLTGAAAADSPAALALIPVDAGAAKHRFTLEAGRHPLSRALDKLAAAHGTNHLYVAADLESASIELKEPLTIDRRNALEAISGLAAACGVMMFPVAAEHGVYEWATVRSAQRSGLADQALYVSAERVRRMSRLRVQVMSLFHAPKLDALQAAKKLRTKFPRGPVQFAVAGSSTVLLTGPAFEVAGAVELLAKAAQDR